MASSQARRGRTYADPQQGDRLSPAAAPVLGALLTGAGWATGASALWIAGGVLVVIAAGAWWLGRPAGGAPGAGTDADAPEAGTQLPARPSRNARNARSAGKARSARRGRPARRVVA